MQKLIILILICFCTTQSFSQDKNTGIQLLEGYKFKRLQAFDAATWAIYKEGGLTIVFEAGLNQGLWADPKKIDQYAWYREQNLNGRKVKFALIKSGLKTVWEPDQPRSSETGNILLVTFPLNDSLPDYTANFKAEILNDQEMADALLMILTFNPNKY